ncbi:MAG: hypothetical protein ACRCZI_06665 [Cetobacterium sp.]
MHPMTRHYLHAALWASTDPVTEEPMDLLYSVKDFADTAVEQAERDCMAFLKAHAAQIQGRYKAAGHDLWFTRNHHGVGFWEADRPWGQEAGENMTVAAQELRELAVVIGDDGRLYLE